MEENKKQKKFRTLILIILILLIVIIAIIAVKLNNNSNVFDKNNNQNQSETSNIEDEIVPTIPQNLYPIKDYELAEENKTKLIKSVDELKNYLTTAYPEENFDNLITMYSEDYFSERALALTYVKVENNKQIPSVDSLNIDENNLEIGYSLKDVKAESEFTSYVIVVETDLTLTSVTSVKL